MGGRRRRMRQKRAKENISSLDVNQNSNGNSAKYRLNAAVKEEASTCPEVKNSNGNSANYRLNAAVKEEASTDHEVKCHLKNKIRNAYCHNARIKDSLYNCKLDMKASLKDKENKVQTLYIGKSCQRLTKIILLVGATGTGKTTLINAMINYMFGIDFTDDFRFVVIDEKEDPLRDVSQSQTDYITAYTFNNFTGMPFDYDYVLIDTPGFGDTRGIDRDREMIRQIESFLNQRNGIDQIDAVGFVIPASTTRLTMTQKYVLDGLSSLFGNDIKDNIFIMATFADARKPPVLKALAQSDLSYGEVFKFNNSALYATNKFQKNEYEDSDESEFEDEECVEMSKQYWDMATKSMEKFFGNLGKVDPVSLTLTKEVLEERRHLQTVLYSLQAQVQMGLDKLSILNQERHLLSQIDDEMKGCSNHYMVIDVPEMKEVHLSPNECTTNCVKCSFTCHFPCHLSQTDTKLRCAAMKEGICMVCPEKCGFGFHKHMDFRYETTWHKEKRTAQELLSRYNKACLGKLTKARVIHKLEEEINNHSQKLMASINEIHTHVNRLEEIALKPNPLSTKEYIDLLVQSEKMQKKSNFEKRIEMLQKLKEEVQILEAARDVDNDLPKSGEALLNHFQKKITDDNESIDDDRAHAAAIEALPEVLLDKVDLLIELLSGKSCPTPRAVNGQGFPTQDLLRQPEQIVQGRSMSTYRFNRWINWSRSNELGTEDILLQKLFIQHCLCFLSKL